MPTLWLHISTELGSDSRWTGHIIINTLLVYTRGFAVVFLSFSLLVYGYGMQVSRYYSFNHKCSNLVEEYRPAIPLHHVVRFFSKTHRYGCVCNHKYIGLIIGLDDRNLRKLVST